MSTNVRNICHILRSIKDYKGFKTNAELAEFLGLSRSAISMWVKREYLDENLIVSKIPEIRLEFLRTGELPMTEQNDIISTLIRRIEIMERMIEKLEKYGAER
ncbi:MAG: helix-turn-helix domain-containing protein [Bacteroidaceae bacterium]|nr:helix-turn-helix domain-containing protein [Bacteroidaceae bacterium]